MFISLECSHGGSASAPSLELRVDWRPLAACVPEAPNSCGIYLLGAPRRIQYPRLVSRVFYVGSSTNLRRRFRAQSRDLAGANTLLAAFLARREQVLAYYRPLPGYSSEQIRGIEFAAMCAFGTSSGMIPHGNRIPPETDAHERLTRVLIVERTTRLKLSPPSRSRSGTRWRRSPALTRYTWRPSSLIWLPTLSIQARRSEASTSGLRV
jgi:hypothetical protein